MFAPFREVLAIDSALLRLHDGLEKLYPSVFTHYMKASAKLAVVMNVVGRGPKTVTPPTAAGTTCTCCASACG